MKRGLVFGALALLLLPVPAQAACTSPAGAEGVQVYNNGSHTMQYCNGTAWVSFGPLDPAAGGGGCTSPAGVERQEIYNTDYRVLQFCDGANWMQAGGYLSNNGIRKPAGVYWTARDSNRSWYGVESSSDGTRLVASEFGGQLYTSTDNGVTWTARDSNRG